MLGKLLGGVCIILWLFGRVFGNAWKVVRCLNNSLVVW